MPTKAKKDDAAMDKKSGAETKSEGKAEKAASKPAAKGKKK